MWRRTARRSQVHREPDGLVKLAAGDNSDGRVAWIQQAGGGQVTFGYDDADGKRTITLPDGAVITQLYDWAGRLVPERLGSAGSHVVYDGEGRVVASVTGIPGTAMTGYAPPAAVTMYNGQGDPYWTAGPDGDATSLTDETGAVTWFGYHTDGHRTSVTGPLGRHVRRQIAIQAFGPYSLQTTVSNVLMQLS